MGVRHTREATSGAAPVPQSIGLNYNTTSYSMSETASASTTLVMLRVPAGARIVDAVLTIDNDALDATGGGQVSVATAIGLSDFRNVISTGSGSLQQAVFKPAPAVLGLRLTASANLVVRLNTFVNTGTAATVFRVAVLYDCQQTGD